MTVQHTGHFRALHAKFLGKQIIHPSQILPVSASFTPPPEKIDWARYVHGITLSHAQTDKRKKNDLEKRSDLRTASLGNMEHLHHAIRRVMSAYETPNQDGAFVLDGKMIDMPSVKQAQNILTRCSL